MGDIGVDAGEGENELDTGLLKGTLHWPFPVPLLFGVISLFRVIQTTQRGTKLLAAAPSSPSSSSRRHIISHLNRILA